mmetsp:Transcript_24906/g.78854  ORF Transcript_24906/g.78854 Transcript_24906/m.78854 type:complete len:305 (-) Transcript_24906:260-1174(-)
MADGEEEATVSHPAAPFAIGAHSKDKAPAESPPPEDDSNEDEPPADDAAGSGDDDAPRDEDGAPGGGEGEDDAPADDGPVAIDSETYDAYSGETPGEEEIAEHAEFLGMIPGEDAELLWVAEMSLMAPMPPGWVLMQDHTGEYFYFNEEENDSIWEHPWDFEYKRLFLQMRQRLWDPVTREEVEEMAAYLGISSSEEAKLLWIAKQAVVAPVPEGWAEAEDENGDPFFYESETGTAMRTHPLDQTFRQLLAHERSKLGTFSFAAAGCNGLDDSKVPMRLANEDASEFYTLDWVRAKGFFGLGGF